ncbi:unnamed protein product [Larinioides sclopetarius]|uniref:Uncharacterized protein n=1 Tax=Larinioides sclopetarius TaxID=280406 RepID=A0AAV2BMC1_9ARAC
MVPISDKGDSERTEDARPYNFLVRSLGMKKICVPICNNWDLFCF